MIDPARLKSVPHTLFVIELDQMVLITDTMIDKCVYPCYRFDNQHQVAFVACEELAAKGNKQVVNSVGCSIWNAKMYAPVKALKPKQSKLVQITDKHEPSYEDLRVQLAHIIS